MADPVWVDGTTPLNAANMTKLQTRDEKAAANGYPSLDATGKVPAAQLPAISSVDYAGAYNPATTYHAGEYVVGADGITYQCVKDGTVGISPTPWATAPALSYGTTLPASPGDGMEAVLVDSITNPSYQWRFRYNAGSSSAYKWEFIGGAPAYANVDTNESTASTTYTDLATPGPSIVLPRAGDYLIDVGCEVNVNGNANYAFMSFAVGATAPLDVDGAVDYFGTTTGNAAVFKRRRKLGVSAVTVTAKYRTANAFSPQFGVRFLSVTPLRVS